MMRALLLFFALVSGLQSIANAGCADEWAITGHQKYSTIARKLGLEFLMVPMRQSAYFELREVEGGLSTAEIVATNTGISNMPPGLRQKQAMRPLLQRDVGKWAHQLIYSGDSISDGIRTSHVDSWMIGLIYSVEILDRVDFQIGNFSEAEDRRSRLGNGVGAGVFSSRQDGLKSFEDLLDRLIAGQPDPSSFDVENYFEFHFEHPLKVKDAALVWIPAPVAAKHKLVEVPHSIQFNQNDFSVRTRIATRSTEGWIPVTPFRPDENLATSFNSSLRVLTAFNLVPDWREIKAELDSKRK